MTILFVASRFPFPPIQGDRLRGYHHLRILSYQHHIVLVTPPPERDRENELKTMRPFCKQIELVSTPSWLRFWRLHRTPFTSLPLQTLYFFDTSFRQRVQSLLQRRSFDLIHVQLVRMAPVVDNLMDIPKVIDLIDALSLNMARRARRERWPVAWLAAIEARRVHRYEQVVARKYSQLIVSSPLDREVIGNYDNVHVIPNGVDAEAYPFIEEGREEGMIIFTGRMGYFPNADAAVWFVEKALPLIRSHKPKTKFFIVGADPSQKVKKLTKHENVFVTGYVPNLREYLERAIIAVAPMQCGSGMQIKVLEAMASGVPVVASPYALGGIEIIENEHLFIARDEHEFAEKVVHLLSNKKLRRQIARNARSLVEKKYTWERSVEMLENVYRLAISK